jgi:5'-deoxynucleotidase YfbR-like HD superfamily hydrolase
VARWNGQTRGEHPYSVAEHSLLVERIAARLDPALPPHWRLATLLHDAPEYVLGDMISPVKATIGPGYGELDQRLSAAVHLRFGLPATLPAPVKALIKQADRASAWLEAVEIAGFTEAEATRLFGRPRKSALLGETIILRPAAAVRADYVARHAALLRACSPG